MSDNRTLGAIAGAVIGYFTGGASYVALGATLGGAVGGALDGPTKTEGPRIDDQKVTVSTYGAGIPTVYGTVRIGGNVVDSTDKIELPFTSESGGKGGGGVENTTYRYFVHMRHVLCATPLDGSDVAIRKIWQDGKLIYDVSTGVSLGSSLATADSPYSNLILYQGKEDQMPDFIEETYHGVGNVPAYRGVVSVRLNIIECPGGRVPQFSFEIAINGAGATSISYGDEQVIRQAQPLLPNVSISRVEVGSNPVVAIVEEAIDQGNPVFNKGIRTVSIGSNYASSSAMQVYDQANNFKGIEGNADIDAIAFREFPATTYVDTGTNIVLDVNTNEMKRFQVGLDYPVTGFPPSRWSKYGNRVVFCTESVLGVYYSLLFNWDDGTPLGIAPIPLADDVRLTDDYLWSFITVAGVRYVNLRSANDMMDISTTALPSIMQSNTLRFVAKPGNTIKVWIQQAGTQTWIYSITAAMGVLTYTEDYHSVQPLPLFITPVVGISGSKIMGVDKTPVGVTYVMQMYLIDLDAVVPEPIGVGAVIAEQCQKAGLTPDGYDVSTLTDEVWGYTLTNPASARSNIQPLMAAFAIDAVEQDAKIRFFKRASLVSSGLISYEELGGSEASEESGDPMPLTRAQEAELPRSVSVSYINKDFDYQTGTEKAIRQVTDSVMDATVDLPMSVDSNVAATVAQRVMFDAWNDRNARAFKIGRKFAYGSAGDVFTFEYPKGTLSDWRWVKVTDTGSLLEGECVPANPLIYAQTAIGGAGYSGRVVPALAPPTRLQLLDIPLLRDEDNNAGIYAAMDSYGDVPASAELFVGDDDSTLVSRGTVSASAPIGTAESVPPSWPVNLVDETNVFTVDLGDDVFNSVTRDVLLANGGEFWALGAPGRWEIGCSALGSSLGGGRFILSRHLRGLFGTEYLTGTHVAGDVFVLLRIAGMLRPSMGVGDLGSIKKYRAVTKGRSTDSTPSQSYANMGEGLEPHNPVNARRAFSSRDIQVDRRSRLNINNVTGTLPLGENVEAFQWKFYTSSSFTTILATAVTSNSTITEAQQTAAGVTPSATAYIRVAQISDSVGTGHELQATV